MKLNAGISSSVDIFDPRSLSRFPPNSLSRPGSLGENLANWVEVKGDEVKQPVNTWEEGYQRISI